MKNLCGLHPTIDVPTRVKSSLGWCLSSLQRIKFLGDSSDNTIIVKSTLERSGKRSKKTIFKRDLRDSCIRPLGQWIVLYDWSDVFSVEDCEQKFDRFNVLSSIVELYFPYKLTIIRNADKPACVIFFKVLHKKTTTPRHSEICKRSL